MTRRIIRTISDLIKEFGEIPLCSCGCNNSVNIKTDHMNYSKYKLYGYPKFIKGHNRKGVKLSQEQVDKIIKNHADFSGDKSPLWGRKLSEIHRKHISENHADVSGENGAMFGRRGKLCPSYIDGRSKLPYCEKWTPRLREQVRIRDGCVCQKCGLKQSELFGFHKRLSVHHIHYDKQNCYPDLITLCIGCNIKANTNRSYWEQYYMNKLNERELLFWTIRIGKDYI